MSGRAPRKRKATRKFRDDGMLPGESRRQSLITVLRDVLSMSGERAEATDEDHFVLTTHVIDRKWTFTVELAGHKMVIPGAVAKRMNDHRESITKEQRSKRARNAFRPVAVQDQLDAERAVEDAEAQLRDGL